MRAKRLVLLVCLLALFTTFTAAAAPDQEAIFRQVVAGGGGLIGDGATLLLANTIGEPVVGPLTLAAPFKEAAGFWQDGLAGGQGGMVQSRLYLPALRR